MASTKGKRKKTDSPGEKNSKVMYGSITLILIYMSYAWSLRLNDELGLIVHKPRISETIKKNRRLQWV